MHELSLTSGLIRTIEALALEHRATKVVTVSVLLGALSNISEAHFRDHFTTAARGTIAETAILVVLVGDDIEHPNAQHVMLESVEFDE